MAKMSWKEFIETVEKSKEPALSAPELIRLIKNTEFTPELVDPHVNWSDEHYVRTPLYRSEKLEALVLCWEDGQATVIHDHGPSCSVATVYKGSTKVENFRRADKGENPGFAKLETIEVLHLKKGDTCGNSVGAIHAMGNDQGGRKRLITINFYSPPLSTIQTFDRETGAIGTRTYPALLSTL